MLSITSWILQKPNLFSTVISALSISKAELALQSFGLVFALPVLLTKSFVRKVTADCTYKFRHLLAQIFYDILYEINLASPVIPPCRLEMHYNIHFSLTPTSTPFAALGQPCIPVYLDSHMTNKQGHITVSMWSRDTTEPIRVHRHGHMTTSCMLPEVSWIFPHKCVRWNLAPIQINTIRTDTKFWKEVQTDVGFCKIYRDIR